MQMVNHGSADVLDIISRIGNGAALEMGLTLDKRFYYDGAELSEGLFWRFFHNFNQNSPAAQQPQVPQTPCHMMADVAQAAATDAINANPNNPQAALAQFDEVFSFLYHGPRMNSYENMKAAAPGTGRWLPPNNGQWIGGAGFQRRYQDSDPALPPPDQFVQGPESDQTHHFSAHLSLGINRRMFANEWRNLRDNTGDARLGQAAYEIGRKLSGMADRGNSNGLRIIGEYIRRNICTGNAGRGLDPRDWEMLRDAFTPDLHRR